MATTSKWFPDARAARFAVIEKTTAYMADAARRARMGFAAGTPNGIWYDSVYTPKLTAYSAAYRTWDNPATSTRLALDNLKDAEKAFFPLYRQFHALAKVSPSVTSADQEGMGFPPRPSGERSRHPVDRMFIDLYAQPIGILVLKVGFKNRDNGAPDIPYYLTGAMIFYVFSDTPVVDQNELTRSKLATRSPHEFIFEPELRGKTVYLAARWQNRRGELGPWSDIVKAVIP
jgi:hypothetical protein